MFGEIAKGMGITLKNFFKKPITVLYPTQLRHMHSRFRGAVGFVRDDQTGKERCVGCGLCSAACPANCLTVVPGVDEYGIRSAKLYLYDMSRCVFCGMCVEACPELALVMTHEFELSVDDRSKLVLDAEGMLALADRELGRTGQAIEEPGFPAFDNAPTGFLKHHELPPRAQRGNFQSHQPLMGTLPHGYPMSYKDFLKKAQSGKPLSQGTLNPHLRGVQNKYLPKDQSVPLPKALEQFARNDNRTHLETTSDLNGVYRHEIMDQDINGKITRAYMEEGTAGPAFKASWIPKGGNSNQGPNQLPEPSKEKREN
ncbi:MAG: NADH-quinone oxidoreductase subunit I [Chloroflexota bacterium]|nr:NADH-quinone oxidoreductase subunit I [Chloroflexota bacterium]